ncbi:cation-independent mannose-6-phosphate receptor [Lepeophtheirus salmonis]|uniref:cation-independent mannose-6-phosphate receptor n=1 Tax=Lepeophtheirus salmonis TaxID=72036 RepID=UPI003AF3CB3A
MVEDLIYVEYIDGDKCEEDPTLKYSVIVRFVCPKYDSPMYLDIIQNGRCIYIFNVYTSFVCVDHRRKCGISTNEGYHYDFSPLIKPVDSSYVVDDSWRLNICQSVGSCGVVDKKSYPVSICNGTNPSLYRVMSKGFLINEKLQLIYEHGDICPAEQNKTLSSVISFKCDPEIYPGYPSKIQDSDHCQINFEFPTALACKDLQIPYIYTAHSCKIYHAGRREFVDFSEVETHNAEFGWTLSPCQNPSCSVCGNGSSYGHIHSSQYDFHHESLIIENQGGSLCNDNATRRSSRIWFKCDRSLAKGEKGIVKLLYKNPCYAEFEWTMSLVCIPFEYEYENHFVEEVDSKSKYEG